ncbi:MAG: family 78 glycoside hydrolase catalytic domain [Eubacteriales bacterium]|nr:family 78 glycoside hydrolase catalytic domain [Eubacteriales bacterium]
MKIRSLKCNRLTRPMGFALEEIKLSWVVDEAEGAVATAARIEVSTGADFAGLCYDSGFLPDADSAGTLITLDTQPNTYYYWRVTVRSDAGEEGTSPVSFFATGRQGLPWRAKAIAAPFAEHPVFVRRFTVKEPLALAMLNICGVGLYEAYLNGQKVGDEYLTPNCNDYKTFLQYQTYDVTPLLQDENEMRVYVGDGWYKGRFGLENGHYGGDTLALLAEMTLRYADGREEVLGTDEAWQCETSPILGGGIYDGEQWDFTRPVSTARAVPGALDISLVRPRISPPVRVMQRVKPLWVRAQQDGSLLVDMGQNMAGLLRFYNRQPAGVHICFAFGETLQQGKFYNDNYRTALGKYEVVCDGTEGWLRPYFTYFGFRYVRITGFATPLDEEDLCGLVLHSDMDRTGCLTTPSEKVNRLYHNALWSQRGNFVDVPTDCPQRDERLGWTGDAQVFSATATYNMDTLAFYRKYLNDLHIEQDRRDGGVPAYAPTFGEKDMAPPSSVWSDAITIIPDNLYRFYGDIAVLRENYPYMKAWLAYIQRRVGEGHYLFDVDFHYGDWLALDGATSQSVKGGTEDEFVASVYFYNSARITARTAGVLGLAQEHERYHELAQNIQKAIYHEYFTPSGRLSIDTQTGYLICLRYGVYPHRQKLLRGLSRRFQKDLYTLKAGFVGAAPACQILCENGFVDLAYKLLLRESYPGWLYQVNLGATTIWERWNSLLADGSVSGTGMNSLNHYAYGSVVEFLYADVAGLKPARPGFGEAVVRPYINHRMPAAKASYDSPYGVYAVDWRIDADNRVTMELRVPFGCRAHLPYDDILPETLQIDGAGRHEARETEHLFGAGSFSLTYRTRIDHAHPFSRASIIEDVLAHPAARRALGEHLPQMVSQAQLGDEEKRCETIENMLGPLLPGSTPEKIKRADEALRRINVFE